MATTQAEKQQNDVNSEKVQSDQHLNVCNSLMQNGTDKSSVRGGGSVVVTKGKNTGSKNLDIEMSQYRQDGGGGGEQNLSEPEIGSTGESGIYPTPPVSEGPPVGDGHGYGGFSFGGRDMHNSGDGGLHAFSARQGFGGPKQPPGAFSQQRFLSGQTISQPTGPTPTLNQLLQSSNPMHKYQNSYSSSEQSYNQAWPPQKPLAPYAPSGASGPAPGPTYRNQSTLSPAYSGTPTPSPGYGEGRSCWSGPPVTGQHGPGSPGPPPTSTPASQPSPQPSQPPSHSPGPGLSTSPQHQTQSSAQHQNFPSRPAQPTTPNTHGPDTADLSGGNSNDSSGGPAPGTPNSQGMRPTPSPTGSTGSRSMSPAVGQQNIPMPPRPSSGQSDGQNTRVSHSPMATQGSYPPSHMHAGYGSKAHSGMIPPTGQQIPLYQPSQQYSQYSARPQGNLQYPQGYGSPASQPAPNNNLPPQQYPNRPSQNHMTNSQFQGYPQQQQQPQQQWPAPVVSSGNHVPPSNKGNGPPPQAPNSPSSVPPRPPHYLKQHLQHKINFGSAPSPMPPSPSPPQNFHMGPPIAGHHPTGMGPPPSMGPPNMPPTTSPLIPNSHTHDGPMPPPSSTPNSHNQVNSDIMDNGITTTASGGITTHVTAASGGSVTSVVTTGPDGTPIDEGSQQSTLSNASAASGEDPTCATPKTRKNDVGHYSHPTTPQSTVPSPGAASMNSMHEDYEMNSPSWPRTPASPVYNTHVPPPDTYRSKKTDSLSKLYEMDDSPERRSWLDKLLAFMEERRTPITTCPTISKNPLDLFRLYIYVKERGGFMEVTKNKTWKDIAGMLGIGASSSAAYTLRKHYTKNLLAYECQFDRGGIDPQPIINQVEASSKKKGAKAASVPSPGSSNSQDSFPTPGSGGASMDGYGGYGYPPGGNADYNASPQRPSSQSNAPSPHAGSGGANHLTNSASGGPSPAGGAADNVNVSNPFDDVSPNPSLRSGGPFPAGAHPPYPSSAPPRSQGQNFTGQTYNQYPGPGAPPEQYSAYPGNAGYPPSRPVYPQYSNESNAPPAPSPNHSQPTPPTTQDPYRYNIANAPAATYTPRTGYGQTPGTSGPPTSQSPVTTYTSQQEYYRPEQPNYPNQQTPNSTNVYPGGPPPNKNMPPPSGQPRRHPDFSKEQQPPYNQYGQQRPQMYGAWANNNQQYRGQYSGGPAGPTPAAQQWNQGARPTAQWDRYSGNSQNYQAAQQNQQQWSPMPTPGVGQSSPLRPPHGPRGPTKPFNILPPQTGKGIQSQSSSSGSYNQGQLPKREITFPPDSVEATLPVLYRRKRMCRGDLGPVDAWRIIMSLRSGLLAESCYALDVLNVLLFDDSSVAYFGLSQWPGLLELLLEHFRKSLCDMFEGSFAREDPSATDDVDLGGINTPFDPELKTILLSKATNNYTMFSRKGFPVKLIETEELFIRDNQKDWDVLGDIDGTNRILAPIDTDPWHHNANHLIPTFQAEFGRISFNVKLDDRKAVREAHENVQENDKVASDDGVTTVNKSSEKRHRTKTLSDVISRIKQENTTEEVDVFALENKDKIAEEVMCEKESCEEKPLVDLNDSSVNDECTNKLTIRDVAGTLKRRRMSDYEDEAYSRDEASLVLLTESQDCVGKRCMCISNILRSLTFIPGNEGEFARSSTFLGLVGKLLLLYHDHPLRTQKTRNYDREEDADFADSCSSLQGENEWWWDFLLQIRENVLVSISNIAGQIDLDQYPEEVARPLLDGLLHWAICPSAQGQDPFPSAGPSSLLSPQRLALEALCKLCVTNSNVDLVIATPPFSRLERLCAVLTKHLCRSEDQVLREFSINLLHYMAAADTTMARVVAIQQPCISLLVAFIEQAEQSALGVANQHGIGALRDNPDSMGTSLDMLRRAASTLVFLAEHPENRPLLIQQESRLLALVMSQILDQQVALLLSKVLFKISHS